MVFQHQSGYYQIYKGFLKQYSPFVNLKNKHSFRWNYTSQSEISSVSRWLKAEFSEGEMPCIHNLFILMHFFLFVTIIHIYVNELFWLKSIWYLLIIMIRKKYGRSARQQKYNAGRQNWDFEGKKNPILPFSVKITLVSAKFSAMNNYWKAFI